MKKEVKEIGELVGKKLYFYGAANNCLRVRRFGKAGAVGTLTFEVREDEDDGYRSSMIDDVCVVTGKTGFFRTHVAVVTLERELADEHDFVGYRLTDSKGHVWLRFGTDKNDNLYPTFVFEYEPSGAKVKRSKQPGD